jgi:outer membrane receptor protein involved in Fe transport
LFGINNPDLRPESAWQYEMGTRKRLRSGGQVEFSVFRIDADDLIVLRPRPAGVPGPPKQLANAGQATRDGFEVGARWPAGVRTALYANFSYLDPGEIREQTVGRKLAVGVDQRLGHWMLSGDLQYVDRLFDYDQTNTLVKVPAFTVVNVKASRPLARGARLGIVVENLFNHSYRVDPAYPYPMPGRSVRLQLEKSW